MLLNSAAVLVYMERKVAAFVQQRYGPYLTGPRGMLQPIADIVKLIFRKSCGPRPRTRSCSTWRRSSRHGGLRGVCGGAVRGPTTFFVCSTSPSASHRRTSTSPAGDLRGHLDGRLRIVLAGWSSNSKYSLLGSPGRPAR